MPHDIAPPVGVRTIAAPEPAFACTFEADAFAVRRVLRSAVARFVRRIGVNNAGVLELILAEVLNNVVEHGYAGDSDGLVRVVIRRGEGGLFCRVEDAGSPVPDDILDRSGGDDAEFSLDAEVPEGGYGWKLIRSLVTDITYIKDTGFNRMTFRIPLPPFDAALPQSCRNESQSKPESDTTTVA